MSKTLKSISVLRILVKTVEVVLFEKIFPQMGVTIVALVVMHMELDVKLHVVKRKTVKHILRLAAVHLQTVAGLISTICYEFKRKERTKKHFFLNSV